MKIVIYIIEVLFELGLFINAVLFVPQAVKIIKEKSAKGVSLITFLGFWLITLFVILHAYIAKDYLLLIGSVFSLLTCGLVVLLIIFYRKR